MAIEDGKVDIRSNINDIAKEIENIERKLNALENKKLDIKVSTGNIQNVNKQLADIESKVATLNAQRITLGFDRSGLSQAQSQLKGLRFSLVNFTSTSDSFAKMRKELGDGFELIKSDLEKEKDNIDGKGLIQLISKNAMPTAKTIAKSLLETKDPNNKKAKESQKDNETEDEEPKDEEKKLGKFDGALKKFKGIADVSSGIAQSIQDIDQKVPTGFADITPKLLVMAGVVGSVGAAATLLGIALKGLKIEDQFDTGIAAIAAIGITISQVAQAMQDLDTKVPDNMGLGDIVKKLGLMTVTIVLTLAAAWAMGKALTKSEKLTAVIAVGAIGIIGLALTLSMVADAIDDLNKKVPTSFGDIGKKLLVMAGVLGAMAGMGLVGAVAGVANIAGSIGTSSVAKTIKAYVEIAENLQKLNGISINQAGAEAKIDAIQKASEKLAKVSRGDSIKGFLSTKRADTKGPEAAMKALKSMAKSAEAISSMPVVEQDVAETKIGAIASVVNAMTENEDLNFDGLEIDTKGIEKLSKFIETLTKISESFNALSSGESSFDPGLIKARLENIKEGFKALTDGEGNINEMWNTFKEKQGKDAIATDIAGEVEAFLSSIVNISKSFATLSKGGDTIDIGQVKSQLEAIQGAFEELVKSGGINKRWQEFKEKEGENGGMATEVAADVQSFMNSIVAISKAFATLTKSGEAQFKPDQIAERINAVIAGFKAITESEKGDSINQVMQDFQNKNNTMATEVAQSVQTFMESIVAINEAFKTLADAESIFKEDAFETNIDAVNTALGKLIKKEGISKTINDLVNGKENTIDENAVKKVKTTVLAIKEINDNLKLISENAALENIDTILGYINAGIKEITEFEPFQDNKINLTTVETIKKAMIQLVEINNQMLLFGEKKLNKENIDANLEILKGILKDMAAFKEAENLDSFKELLTSFNNLITSLTEMGPSFTEVGKNFGNKIVEGFKNVDVPAKLEQNIKDAETKISKRNEAFGNLGTNLGNAFKAAFESAMGTFETIMDTKIGNIQRKIDSINEKVSSTRDAANVLNNSIFDTAEKPKEKFIGPQLPKKVSFLDNLTSGFGYAQAMNSVKTSYFNNVSNVSSQKVVVNQNNTMSNNPAYIMGRASRYI